MLGRRRTERESARARRAVTWIDVPQASVTEEIDALERARGGKWRESRTLAPDEEVIEDARLT